MSADKIREYISNAGQLFYRMKLPVEFVDVVDRDWAPDVGLSKLLYHYTSPVGFEGICNSSTVPPGEPDNSTVRNLRATHHRCLNDENEIQFGFDVVDRVIRDLNQEIPPRVLENLTSKIDFLKGIPAYLTSFSTRYDSLSQWRAYANNAAGYCLGFRAAPYQHSGYHGIHNFGCVFECLYGEANVRAALAESLRIKLARQKELDGQFPNQDMLYAAELAMVAWRYAHQAKHEHFKEEDEWRFVTFASFESPKYRMGYSGLIPYIEMPFPLEEVWIGPRIWPANEMAREAVQSRVQNVPSNKIQFWASPYRS